MAAAVVPPPALRSAQARPYRSLDTRDWYVALLLDGAAGPSAGPYGPTHGSLLLAVRATALASDVRHAASTPARTPQMASECQGALALAPSLETAPPPQSDARASGSVPVP